MHFSTFSAGFAFLSCRFDSLLWKIIPVLLDEGNKVEFFRLTQTSFFVRRKNSTLFPSSSKSGIIFHSALSNLQVRNAKRTEKVEKCISLELLFFLTERKYSLTLNCQESTIFKLINFYQMYENLSGVITGKEMTFTTMFCNFLKLLILQVSNWFWQMLEWNICPGIFFLSSSN